MSANIRAAARRSLAALCGLGVALLFGAGSATAVTIDFDSAPEGTIVEQADGVDVSAVSLAFGPDAAVLFDSEGGAPIGLDLQGPPWAGGNLADASLGNILLIPERLNGDPASGMVDRVDLPFDESRTAGFLVFGFDVPVLDFGLDLIDVEPDAGEALVISFFSGGDVVGVLRASDLMARDGSIQFGDGTANRVLPVSASDFGVASIDQVQVNLGGLGAVDNLSFTPVPEPGTAALMLLGLAGLARLGSRRA